jgi:hypothetical protein
MQMTQQSIKRPGIRAGARWAGGMLAAIAVLLATGCGGGKTSNGSGFSNPAPAANYNNYVGTQTYQLASDGFHETGGVWSVVLDDANQFFTYADISIPPYDQNGGSQLSYPIEGNFNGASGFLNLTLNGMSKGSGGYAIEIPGRAAILRPGNDSTLPVISVAASTSACQGLAQQTTFEFLPLGSLPADRTLTYADYGTIQMNSNGLTWSFSNLQMFAWDGTSLNPPTPATGLCSYTKEGYVTTISPSKETQNLPWTVSVGPTGYMVIDQGQGNGPAYDGPTVADPTIGPYGLVGFPEPVSQLDTSSLVSGSYIGFTYDAYAGEIGRPATQPIAFTGGSGTVATGGLYPNDDVTQTPPAAITMDLGAQDSKTNGFYPSVTVTMPDVYGGCILQSYGGTDANGNPTCIAHGVAIAASIEGKYVLFVSLKDRSMETISSGLVGADLEYFLYQQ